MVRTTEPACYIAACEALAAFDIRAELGRIGVPTLVLVGAEDQVTGPAEARTLVAGIPDARLAVVPGASHLVPVEQPAAVTDLLIGTSRPPGSSPLRLLHRAIRSGAAASPVSPRRSSSRPSPRSPRPRTRAGRGRPDPYEAGMRVRREVLGDEHVDRAVAAADEFTEDFQELITRYAWGEIWTGPASTAAPAARHADRARRGRPPRRAGVPHPGRSAQRPQPGRDQGSPPPGRDLLRGAGRERAFKVAER